MQDYLINFNEEKNQLLKVARKVSFDEVVNALEEGRLIAHLEHFKKKKYPNQYLLLIEVVGYIYVVPYIKDDKNKELYLKTVYPSRKLTKIYRRLNEK